MRIREATITDLEAWAEMRAELWPESPDDHPVELAEYFSGESKDIEVAFIIEEESGEMSGFIELNIRDYAEGSRVAGVAYVEGWYVRPAYQGRGYGRALIERTESWARGGGFTELASDAEIDNEQSIAAHERLGFEETDRVVCFLKKLTD